MVQSALRYGDRAGLVALGSRDTRWLGADIGQRQFYRILDTILGAPTPSRIATGTLAPRPAVPPGAIVIAFSTMLETEFALALIDLRKRGHAVVAVDVLEGCPVEGEHDPLVNRMWTLQRSFMYRDMATVGVDIVGWPGTATLDQAMALAPDHRTGSAAMTAQSVKLLLPSVFGVLMVAAAARRADGPALTMRGRWRAGRGAGCGVVPARRDRGGAADGADRRAHRSRADVHRARGAGRHRVSGSAQGDPNAPTMLFAVGFAATAAVAVVLPVHMPWLVLAAPLALLAGYLLALKPFVAGAGLRPVA